MKEKVIRLFLWAAAAFFTLFALVFFPSFSSVLFLLSALLAAPIAKVQDFLYDRGLRNRVKALLTAAIFIAGCLSAPPRPSSDTAQPSSAHETAKSVSDAETGNTPDETSVEPSDSKQGLSQEASVDNIPEPAAPFWDADSMGNHPNVLLSGGKLYCRDGLAILPETDSVSYLVTWDSGESVKIDRSMSYINVWDNKIIYRDDATRHICVYDMETRTDTELLTVNAGEVFVSGGQIFFSDLGQGASLFRASLDGGGTTNVVLRSTGSFVVNGNQMFYLGNDQTLYSGALSPSGGISGTPEALASPAERFFLDNIGLLVESGSTIFRISPDGEDTSKVYSSDNDDMRFVGVCDENIFYQENGNLYVLGNEINPIISTFHLYYASPAMDTANGIMVVAYDKASDGAGVVEPHLLSLPANALITQTPD